MKDEFMKLFGLEQDIPYFFRCVGRFEEKGVFVSTAYVTDTNGYETAVAHPCYNGGKLVIVEEYRNKEEAETGHKIWVKKMTQDYDKLPQSLQDVSSAFAEACLKVLDNNWAKSKKAPKICSWKN